MNTQAELKNLNASDIMSRNVVTVSADLSLRDAARHLTEHQVRGAPVVDAEGRCIGVLSSSDFLRWTAQQWSLGAPMIRPQDSCAFQLSRRNSNGMNVTICSLPADICPVQRKEKDGDREILICSQPRGVFAEWQLISSAVSSRHTVKDFMTSDPVSVPESTNICELAKIMIDGMVHRVLVVDENQKPVGLVSATDILAAVAREACSKSE